MSNEIMAANNSEYICTIAADSFEGAKSIANAINASNSLADYGDKIFTVVDIMTMPGVRAKTGEPCTQTYFILSDGTSLFTQADGIARSVKALIKIIGPWIHEGVDMRVKSTPTRNGNTVKTVELV